MADHGARAAKRTDAACILMSGAEGDPETQARLAGIRQGLSRFGWSEGRNVEIDYRYASASAEQARLLARELVALKPEVIVAAADMVAIALQRETRAIPIVFVGAIDPVGAGLVASLARPGGNLTGTLLNEEGIVGKWLAMLKEMAPQLARVAILFNAKMDEFEFAAYRQTAEGDARSLGIQLSGQHRCRTRRESETTTIPIVFSSGSDPVKQPRRQRHRNLPVV